MIPEGNRFESDPAALLGGDADLPPGWVVGTPDGADPGTVRRLAELLRGHESAGRGWAGSGEDEVLVEVSERALATRENVVVRDDAGTVQAWASVHDRAAGRMLLVHVVARDLPDDRARRCAAVLFAWAEGQARAVGAARGLASQQIDTGAFADDRRQHEWLAGAGFERVRTWWQMSRPVAPDEADLVPDARRWEERGVVFRQVRSEADGMPDEDDVRTVHDVLEGAFTGHFNSAQETFDEFVHRIAEDPGHRWEHWWLAELADGGAGGREVAAVGALVGAVTGPEPGSQGSYVSYLGVLEAARGRGVAKGLLRTVIADAAARGRDRVGLEVDADSPTGAEGLYLAMGWQTRYVTESWHRDVRV